MLLWHCQLVLESPLCFAVLPLVSDSLLGRPQSISIVICGSPLTSLMQDQRARLLHEAWLMNL